MAKQVASTVSEYLASLNAVRKVIVANLDPKFKEGIQYGMIGYFLPLSAYPAGYHCNPEQPLPFASMASLKGNMALYLFCNYTQPGEAERFAKEWKATGKRLDMGKSCVRFKKLEDVPLDVLGAAIKRMTAAEFVASYEAALSPSAGAKRKATSKKKVAKKCVTKKKVAKKRVTKKKA